MVFLGLDDGLRNQLQYEVVPHRARLQLTRMLREAVYSTDYTDYNGCIARMNNVINICRNVLGKPVSIIEVNNWGDYEFVDTGWMRAELEVSMRRPATPELVETVADLIQDGWLDREKVNQVLASNGCSFSFSEPAGDVLVEISSIDELEAEAEDENGNIRLLVDRMERALQAGDYAEVLHASASVFETLAKETVATQEVQQQTLASFFDRYRKDSGLPARVLDYIVEVYKRRSTEPCAAHGHLNPPTIDREEAIFLLEETKAIVRMERRLSEVQVSKTLKNPRTEKP